MKIDKLHTSTEKNIGNRSERGDFFITKESALTLQDGTTFAGQKPTWQKQSVEGEVVFNTGMNGYVESMTDPSYAGQILVFTYPLIGNYGVNEIQSESGKIQVAGIIVSELAENHSHSGAKLGLLVWLRSQNIPVLWGVDTRGLTKHLRKTGTMAGGISMTLAQVKKTRLKQQFISITEPQVYNEKYKKRLILVDCGMKQNILRTVMKFPISIKRVPYDYDYSQELFDGVLLSNGPGDPEQYTKTIAITKKILAGNKPVFGICLGNQILALAAGAKTYKLPFGHRGHNQPCMNQTDENCVITSQNHGYAVDEKSLPRDWQVLYKNLNDGSVEGIQHKTKPFFSVQFHPEAAPGPTDSNGLFERFYTLI